MGRRGGGVERGLRGGGGGEVRGKFALLSAPELLCCGNESKALVWALALFLVDEVARRRSGACESSLLAAGCLWSLWCGEEALPLGRGLRPSLGLSLSLPR